MNKKCEIFILLGLLSMTIFACKPTINYLLQEGGAEYDSGHFARAIEFYSQIIDQNPRIQTARFDRSLCYAALGDYSQRGKVYYAMDNVRLAVRDIESCIEFNYQTGPNYVWLGNIFRLTGNKVKACALYTKARWLADPAGDSLVTHYCN